MAAIDHFREVVRELRPTIAVVLGSGQSATLSDLREEAHIHFADVPDLPAPTVAGHSGRIAVGTLRDKTLLVFQGRVHFYEGHSWDKVAAPVRFAAGLGVKKLLLTNAAGGIHPALEAGSMMIVRDHLFLQKPSAWKEPAPAGCPSLAGERPSVYSPQLIESIRKAGSSLGIDLIDGIYAAMTGPCYETPAEIRALQKWGADAVGMSTAFEAETGYQLGLECAAISGITNRGAGLTNEVLNHHDVLKVMSKIREKLGPLIAEFLRASE